MINLIKFEIFKLIKRKSIIILIMLIIFGACINIYLSTINYKPKDDSYKYTELNYKIKNDDVIKYNEYIKDNIKKYNYYKSENIDMREKEKSIIESSVTFLAFMVIVIAVISSGILADEINSKSLKEILLRPYYRTEIISSKFIVMLLTCVVISLLVSISSIVSSSIILGINWFSVKHLYVVNNRIVEIVYLFEYLKLMFINSAPMIFVSGFGIFLSTILNSSKIISAISIFLSFTGTIIFQLFLKIKLNFIQYTFMPYLDMSLYTNPLNIFDINFTYGVSLGLLSGLLILIANYVVFYMLSVIIFNKKNI